MTWFAPPKLRGPTRELAEKLDDIANNFARDLRRHSKIRHGHFSLLVRREKTYSSENSSNISTPLFVACIVMGASKEPRHSRASDSPAATAIRAGAAMMPCG